MAGSDLYVGTLDVLILKALSWGPMHGYGVGRWIRQTTEDVLAVQEGALYPALHRLQRRGWLDDEWGVTETGREAKYYRLTPVGRRQLRSEVERWRAYARAVSTALDAAPA
ncbi:MAG TPA: PadR family transcriptional regulator [Gemmatimonadales bacterium]|jgi:transcriptional regulator|nr:PadR family transcriptional regulator [Gemmatimonadales bacterium]